MIITSQKKTLINTFKKIVHCTDNKSPNSVRIVPRVIATGSFMCLLFPCVGFIVGRQESGGRFHQRLDYLDLDLTSTRWRVVLVFRHRSLGNGFHLGFKKIKERGEGSLMFEEEGIVLVIIGYWEWCKSWKGSAQSWGVFIYLCCCWLHWELVSKVKNTWPPRFKAKTRRNSRNWFQTSQSKTQPLKS